MIKMAAIRNRSAFKQKIEKEIWGEPGAVISESLAGKGFRAILP